MTLVIFVFTKYLVKCHEEELSDQAKIPLLSQLGRRYKNVITTLHNDLNLLEIAMSISESIYEIHDGKVL